MIFLSVETWVFRGRSTALCFHAAPCQRSFPHFTAERRFEVTASIEGGFSQAKVFSLIRFFDCTKTGKPRPLTRSKSKNDRLEVSAVIIISLTKTSFWNTVRMRIL